MQKQLALGELTRDQVLIEEPGSQLITTRTTGTSLMQMSAKWSLTFSPFLFHSPFHPFTYPFVRTRIRSLLHLCPFITTHTHTYIYIHSHKKAHALIQDIFQPRK